MEEKARCKKNSSLLIVDDDQSQLRTLTAIMEEEDFEVIGCSTASDALEHLNHLETGVVVLDMCLPDLSGTQLLERLATATDRIRVIINTAYSSYESAKDALNLGAFAYVEKASDPKELLRHVHRAFAAIFRSYSDQLEIVVAERTRELRQANELLREEINERTKAEEALRRERDKAQRYLDVAGVMLVAVDSEQRVGLINKKGCEILGYKEEEVVARNWFDNFVPEKIREEARAVFEKNIRTAADVSEYYENPILTKSGDERFIAWHNTILKDEKGNVVATLNSGEDITNRKQAEDTLREYQVKLKAMASEILQTEERERKRIAIALHDNLCQNLVLTKVLLQSTLRLVSDPSVSGPLKMASGAMSELIELANSLTFELRNPVLHDLGFVPALEKHLAEEVQQRHGIAFELECDEQLRIPREELRNGLFRISRELLMNVVKHAQARNVEVSVHRSRGQIRIRVQDDGVGFDIDEVRSEVYSTSRFGLFSIREQLEHLGGNLAIESEPGRGTTATVVVPLGDDTLG